MSVHTETAKRILELERLVRNLRSEFNAHLERSHGFSERPAILSGGNSYRGSGVDYTVNATKRMDAANAKS